MSPIHDYDDYTDSYPLHSTGSATTLPAEAENEAVLLLHEAVKEVTGRDVDAPVKPRIGFLP